MSFLSYVNELCICLEICLSSRFMSIVLWPRMTHLPMLFQNACCEWGLWCNSKFWGISFLSPHSSTLAWRIPGMGEPGGLLSMELHRVRHDWSDYQQQVYSSLLKTSKAAFILSPSDVYVRSFFYLFYALIKLYYTKSSERSSLITGPGSNSSPMEATNPGIVQGS